MQGPPSGIYLVSWPLGKGLATGRSSAQPPLLHDSKSKAGGKTQPWAENMQMDVVLKTGRLMVPQSRFLESPSSLHELWAWSSCTVESLGKDLPVQDWQLPYALLSHLTQTCSSRLRIQDPTVLPVLARCAEEEGGSQ